MRADSDGGAHRRACDTTTKAGRAHSVLPNESRLSCGAELKCSQTEFYYAGFPDVHRIP